MTAENTPAGLAITFTPPDDPDAGMPGPGECVFVGEGPDAGQPNVLFVPSVPKAAVLAQAVEGGTFQLHIIPKADGFRVTSIDGIQGVGGTGGGSGAVASTDCPSGTATVATPPGLDFLNVREKPNASAKVLAQLPNESEVTVTGACLQPAAGLVKTLKPKTGGGGVLAAGSVWCRIEQPTEGCVAAQFLTFGDEAPLKPAAGLADDPGTDDAVSNGDGAADDGAATADDGPAVEDGGDGGDGDGGSAKVKNAVSIHIKGQTGSKVIGTLQAGKTVAILGCDMGWCRIQTPGGVGFVSRSFLILSGGQADADQPMPKKNKPPVKMKPAPASDDDADGSDDSPTVEDMTTDDTDDGGTQ